MEKASLEIWNLKFEICCLFSLFALSSVSSRPNIPYVSMHLPCTIMNVCYSVLVPNDVDGKEERRTKNEERRMSTTHITQRRGETTRNPRKTQKAKAKTTQHTDIVLHGEHKKNAQRTLLCHDHNPTSPSLSSRSEGTVTVRFYERHDLFM